MPKSKKCVICERIDLIKSNNNPYFVKELESGYVVIGEHQFYKGYTLLLSKIHVSELHLLENRDQFLKDMATTAEAVYKAFSPKKLNYALLGNSCEHLHWHIFPRYRNDPSPKQPVWANDMSAFEKDSTRPTIKELDKLKQLLKKELETTQPLI